MTSRVRRFASALTIAALVLPTVAGAEEAKGTAPSRLDSEPFLRSEPRIMNEPGEVVDVIDAADERDPFDIDFTLGFGFDIKRAGVTRGGKAVGTYSESSTHLFPKIAVGLYKDLAFYAALPIVLSNSRSVSSDNGKSSGFFGERGDTIASFPFKSPNRSGADYLALGTDVGIMNQTRNGRYPTWMAGAEVRLPIGPSLHACNAAPTAGEVVCASPFDQNRDGKKNQGDTSGDPVASGVGRGVAGIEAHTYLSRRIRFFEPYGGLHGLYEIPIGHSDLKIVAQAGASRPPVEVGGALGTMFIPWENREHFGRLTFDVRSDLAVRSAGSDYSELFDVLGSSSFGTLRRTAFTGVTHVSAYPTGRLGGTAIWQSSRYVKLALGVTLAYAGNHHIAEAVGNQAAAPSLITADPLAVRGSFNFDLGARGVVMF